MSLLTLYGHNLSYTHTHLHLRLFLCRRIWGVGYHLYTEKDDTHILNTCIAVPSWAELEWAERHWNGLCGAYRLAPTKQNYVLLILDCDLGTNHSFLRINSLESTFNLLPEVEPHHNHAPVTEKSLRNMNIDVVQV